MHDVHGARRLKRDNLPRIVADGSVHAVLFRLYDQGHETLCGLLPGGETISSSHPITCVSCLALHDEDLAHIEVMRLYNDHQEVCKMVAQMHAAAVGYVGGPNRGVIEDVQDLKSECDRLLKAQDGHLHEISVLKQKLARIEQENQFLYMKAMAP